MELKKYCDILKSTLECNGGECNKLYYKVT